MGPKTFDFSNKLAFPNRSFKIDTFKVCILCIFVGTFGTVIVHDGDENDKVASQLDIGIAEPPTGSLRNESLSINVTRVDSRYSLSDIADVFYFISSFVD